MNIDESDILDPECYDECKALACLLAEGVCFINTRKYLCIDGETQREDTTVVFVNCNDVFMWGCADAEPITNSEFDENSEIIGLYRLWKENETYGAAKWVCMKRGVQPQKPLKDMMQKNGYWDDKLESLEPNPA